MLVIIINVFIQIYANANTVGPSLSESPLSESLLSEPLLSYHYFEFLNPKIWFYFLQNQTISDMPVWFLDLLGLLYHSTVGRKAYYHVAILLATHAIIAYS